MTINDATFYNIYTNYRRSTTSTDNDEDHRHHHHYHHYLRHQLRRKIIMIMIKININTTSCILTEKTFDGASFPTKTRTRILTPSKTVIIVTLSKLYTHRKVFQWCFFSSLKWITTIDEHIIVIIQTKINDNQQLLSLALQI